MAKTSADIPESPLIVNIRAQIRQLQANADAGLLTGEDHQRLASLTAQLPENQPGNG